MAMRGSVTTACKHRTHDSQPLPSRPPSLVRPGENLTIVAMADPVQRQRTSGKRLC